VDDDAPFTAGQARTSRRSRPATCRSC